MLLPPPPPLQTEEQGREVRRAGQRSGEVHDSEGVWVNRDSPGHGRKIAFVAVSRILAPFTAVVLLFNEVVPGPEGNQVSIIGRCRY